MATDHSRYEPYDDLHKSVGTFDGGACLYPHPPAYYYIQRNSCSYRWQAHHRANGPDKALYGEMSGQFRSFSPTHAANLFEYRALAAPPGPVGPSGLQKVKGLPFRTAFAPWPNNAHHLIPDAQLMNGIFDLAADLPAIQETIVQGLLKSPYNLHHWKNMMILPLDPKQGCALGLPTHPQGDTHPAYNIEVRTGVDEALSPYKAVIKQVADKEKEHEVVDPVDIKEALEALSDALHTSLIALKPEILGACAKDEDISLGAMTQFITTSPGA